MEKLSIQEILQAVGGKPCHSAEGFVTGISIDSRNMQPGWLFIAIEGEHFDGHDFVNAVVEQGAAAVLVHHPVETSVPAILVENTRQALLDLAGYYRSRFSVPVVGVTGSVGKTSTKEMIYTVLSADRQTLKTEGNFNNEIGMPLTLLRLQNSDQAAVIEMGMSGLGEIHALSSAARPDIGVITNIGVSHIEKLGSQENILRAKLEILDGMHDTAPLILNGDDPFLFPLREKLSREILYYGIENLSADIRAENIKQENTTTVFDIVYYGYRVPVQLPVIGRHNVLNALAAFAVGIALDIQPDKMAAALRYYQPAGMRQNVIDCGGVTLINDCYNASPDSMRAALTVLKDTPCAGRRIAVLADMLELGDYSRQAHWEVGKMAAERGIDCLLCCGEAGEYIAQGAVEAGMEKVRYFAGKEEMTSYIRLTVREGDAILFKASRGMHLEQVIAAIFPQEI